MVANTWVCVCVCVCVCVRAPKHTVAAQLDACVGIVPSLVPSQAWEEGAYTHAHTHTHTYAHTHNPVTHNTVCSIRAGHYTEIR